MKDYLKITAITSLLDTDSVTYQKKAITLGKLPSDMVGDTLVTYVKGENGITQESEMTIEKNHVIARNPHCLGQLDGVDVYNEWAMDKSIWLTNYGVEPTDEFVPYKKVALVKAVVINDEILQLLGSEDGQTARISVSWNDDGMEVYKGGVLTDQGYGIAPDELKQTYEMVS